jgi:hypothetical protein
MPDRKQTQAAAVPGRFPPFFALQTCITVNVAYEIGTDARLQTKPTTVRARAAITDVTLVIYTAANAAETFYRCRGCRSESALVAWGYGANEGETSDVSDHVTSGMNAGYNEKCVDDETVVVWGKSTYGGDCSQQGHPPTTVIRQYAPPPSGDDGDSRVRLPSPRRQVSDQCGGSSSCLSAVINVTGTGSAHSMRIVAGGAWPQTCRR